MGSGPAEVRPKSHGDGFANIYFQKLKARCVTFTELLWHEMEQKIHLYVFF